MLFPLFILVGFGAAVLFSAAGGSMSPYADSHLIRFGVFFVMATIMTLFNRDFVRLMTYPVYAIVLILLVGVEAMGAIGGGSQRWLEVGPIRIQPSELMKPVLVLALAKYYDLLPPGMVRNWRALIPAGVLIGMPMALVLMQPDLGTSLALAFGGVVIMFLAGLPMLWFGGAIAAAAVAVPLAYNFALQPYQQRRIDTLFDPESDPLGAGYHITQSKIAIGSGGITGKGFNDGTQSQLNYLPEPHTDFVFATMAEEWGLVGGIVVIGIFAIIMRWGWKVAMKAQDRFSRLLAAGMVATIFFYVAVNLLMVMGFAPVVGIPLPFMSHGGSSMMTNMICIGTLMMVNRWNSQKPSSGLS
ncbi:Rod shape-determining protein RodA [Alteripontixanthobacter maritimus]|uniref:Peptidoglycan glycosyltransferase MrdB n=2 Tax=Alteripontixanthobacter maritimus TaxID=2161824 RepID=A0A369Q581_9SPHN|nr:Rod shape-determining protein RodA [Alteripontixanthobacter maritimus]